MKQIRLKSYNNVWLGLNAHFLLLKLPQEAVVPMQVFHIFPIRNDGYNNFWDGEHQVFGSSPVLVPQIIKSTEDVYRSVFVFSASRQWIRQESESQRFKMFATVLNLQSGASMMFPNSLVLADSVNLRPFAVETTTALAPLAMMPSFTARRTPSKAVPVCGQTK